MYWHVSLHSLMCFLWWLVWFFRCLFVVFFRVFIFCSIAAFVCVDGFGILCLLHCSVIATAAYIIACMSCSVVSLMMYRSRRELMVSIIFWVSFLYISLVGCFLLVGSLPLHIAIFVSNVTCISSCVISSMFVRLLHVIWECVIVYCYSVFAVWVSRLVVVPDARYACGSHVDCADCSKLPSVCCIRLIRSVSVVSIRLLLSCDVLHVLYRLISV